MTLRNPHNALIAIDPPRESPPRRWRCHHCKVEGLLADVQKIECAHTYPPCEVCGLSPICARDCAGVLAALGAGDVRVVGEDLPPIPEA